MRNTVLITGCSSGFGKAFVEQFAQAGWNVAATMRTPDSEGLPPGVFVTRLDVQDPQSISAAVAATLERFGGIDVVINNAGYGLFGVFESTPLAKIRDEFEVNVFGAMEVTRAVLPHFRERRAGTVVAISSGAGKFTLPTSSMYSASKFALEAFFEGLAYEVASLGIKVKIMEPGGVLDTQFVARSSREAEQGVIADYAPFLESAGVVFSSLRGKRLASSADVARVTYAAITDGTDRLRYIATEDIRELVEKRTQMDDDSYVRWLRKQFSEPRDA